MVQRSDLASHLKNDCSYREELCTYCGKRILVIDMTVNIMQIILFQ